MLREGYDRYKDYFKDAVPGPATVRAGQVYSLCADVSTRGAKGEKVLKVTDAEKSPQATKRRTALK